MQKIFTRLSLVSAASKQGVKQDLRKFYSSESSNPPRYVISFQDNENYRNGQLGRTPNLKKEISGMKFKRMFVIECKAGKQEAENLTKTLKEIGIPSSISSRDNSKVCIPQCTSSFFNVIVTVTGNQSKFTQSNDEDPNKPEIVTTKSAEELAKEKEEIEQITLQPD